MKCKQYHSEVSKYSPNPSFCRKTCEDKYGSDEDALDNLKSIFGLE